MLVQNLRRLTLLFPTALAVASCGLMRVGRRPAVLVSSLRDTVLSEADSLNLTRVIYNRSPDSLFLSLGLTDVSFTIRDSAGCSACPYSGVHLLMQVVITILPRDSVVHPLVFPLSSLDRCGPGRYELTVSETVFRDRALRDRVRIPSHRHVLIIRSSDGTT